MRRLEWFMLVANAMAGDLNEKLS